MVIFLIRWDIKEKLSSQGDSLGSFVVKLRLVMLIGECLVLFVSFLIVNGL